MADIIFELVQVFGLTEDEAKQISDAFLED